MKSVDGIDWNLLHKQKLRLLEVIGYCDNEPLLDGLVNLLDSMCDEAEEMGIFTYPNEEELDCMEFCYECGEHLTVCKGDHPDDEED